MPCRDFVRSYGEVAEDEVVLGILRHEQRFQPAMMLLPVRQPAANDGDMIALFQRQLLLRRCRRDEGRLLSGLSFCATAVSLS